MYNRYKGKSNADLREIMRQNHVYQWEIAEHLDISEVQFSRKMRHEFDRDEKDNYIKIISEIKSRKETEALV